MVLRKNRNTLQSLTQVAGARTIRPYKRDRTYRLLETVMKGATVESVPREHHDVIDQALRLVYTHHHRLISRLYPSAFKPLSLEQLREGPLGQDLQRLSMLASGKAKEAKDEVVLAIDSILQLLFWPAGADDYMVPRSFWETPLGRLLAQAKLQAFDRSELVSIGSAAQQLGVTRPTIYRWMDERTLNYVVDDMTGRTFVVRRDIENLRRVAEEFIGEDALAADNALGDF